MPALSFVAFAAQLLAAAQEPNYDESKVPPYVLPDPLICADGTPVTTREIWEGKRRREILDLFEEEMFGRAPGMPGLTIRSSEPALVLGGKAIRQETVIQCATRLAKVELRLLLFYPAKSQEPVPAFLGLNFDGNHTVHPDPEITVTEAWVRNRGGIRDHRATEASRGRSASRWPVELIIDRGYALATLYYGEIDPDYDDEFENGVHALFDEPSPRMGNEWGSISAWAWGLCRAYDYLRGDERIDRSRVAVVGHSRLGKAALWAGALYPHFALVISNNSGCGGAALSRRRYGETVERITRVFPHWFCDNFDRYANIEDELPLDQHMLVALIAPRPVLINSATEDRWADPRGEFLSAYHAAPVYELLGAGGLDADEMPEPGVLVKSRVGYHLRAGKHDVTVEDWEAFLDFADHHGLGPGGRDE